MRRMRGRRMMKQRTKLKRNEFKRMYSVSHWLHIVNVTKKYLGCLSSMCSWIELPKYGNSFPIYRLKWHRQILPSVLDGYFIKASECSIFELAINVPTFVLDATPLSYNCYNHQVLFLPCNHLMLQLAM